MVVYPNSEVYFIKNCPINTENQICFSPKIDGFEFGTREKQVEYFLGGVYVEPTVPQKQTTYQNVAFMVNSASYVRKEKVFQVKRNMEDFTECNYMVFRNHMPRYAAYNSTGGINRAVTETEYPRLPDEYKWFFAFITDVRYINPNVSEVSFKIDVWQTYGQFDVSFSACMIEREHDRKDLDIIGDHNMAEGLNSGEPTYRPLYFKDNNPLNLSPLFLNAPQNTSDYATDSSFGNLNLCTCIFTADDINRKDDEIAPPYPFVVQNLPQMMNMYVFCNFDGANATTLDPYLAATCIGQFLRTGMENNKDSTIMAAVNVPLRLLGLINLAQFNNTTQANSGGSNAWVNYVVQPGNEAWNIHTNNELSLNCKLDHNGYKPRNNKMYTYPYHYIQVNNNGGQTLNLKHENSHNVTYDSLNTATEVNYGINLFGVPLPDCELALQPAYPYGFKNTGESQQITSPNYLAPNPIDTISMTNFPQSVMNRDLYMAWYNANSAKLTGQQISGTLTAALGAIAIMAALPSGGSSLALMPLLAGAGAVLSGGSQVVSTFTQQADAATMGKEPVGQVTSNANIAADMNFFTASIVSLRADIAKSIDRYLSLFGYKVNRFDFPRFLYRPRKYFCYCKTVDCNVIGSVPTVVTNEINDMFNKGIRMWYPLDNMDFMRRQIGFNGGNFELNNDMDFILDQNNTATW